MCAPTSPTTIPVSYPPPEVVSEDNVDMHLDTFADFDELEFEYSTDRSDVLWLFRGSCVTFFHYAQIQGHMANGGRVV